MLPNCISSPVAKSSFPFRLDSVVPDEEGLGQGSVHNCNDLAAIQRELSRNQYTPANTPVEIRVPTFGDHEIPLFTSEQGSPALSTLPQSPQSQQSPSAALSSLDVFQAFPSIEASEPMELANECQTSYDVGEVLKKERNEFERLFTGWLMRLELVRDEHVKLLHCHVQEYATLQRRAILKPAPLDESMLEFSLGPSADFPDAITAKSCDANSRDATPERITFGPFGLIADDDVLDSPEIAVIQTPGQASPFTGDEDADDASVQKDVSSRSFPSSGTGTPVAVWTRRHGTGGVNLSTPATAATRPSKQGTVTLSEADDSAPGDAVPLQPKSPAASFLLDGDASKSAEELEIEEPGSAKTAKRLRESFTKTLLGEEGLNGVSMDFSRAGYSKRGRAWVEILYSPVFCFWCMCVMIANCFFVGFQADCMLTKQAWRYNVIKSTTKLFILERACEEELFSFGARCCYTLFILEMIFRLAVERRMFIFGPSGGWNVFDMGVLVLGLWPVVAPDPLENSIIPNMTVLRIWRLSRMIQWFRSPVITRLARIFRLMMHSIANSVPLLFWALVCLLLVIFFFSLFFSFVVARFLSQDADPTEQSETLTKLLKYYANFPTVVVSLFMAVTGGLDWADPMQPLMDVHSIYGAAFIFFVLAFTIGPLNVITGIFVDNATQISQLNRDMQVQEKVEQDKKVTMGLKQIFEEFDDDKSGTLSWEEFSRNLENEQMIAYLATLELDISDAKSLFKLVDIDETDNVLIDDFIQGCMRLKGAAKSIDLCTLLYENRKQGKDLSKMKKRLDRLEKHEKRTERLDTAAIVSQATGSQLSVQGTATGATGHRNRLIYSRTKGTTCSLERLVA